MHFYKYSSVKTTYQLINCYGSISFKNLALDSINATQSCSALSTTFSNINKSRLNCFNMRRKAKGTTEEAQLWITVLALQHFHACFQLPYKKHMRNRHFHFVSYSFYAKIGQVSLVSENHWFQHSNYS